MITARDLLNEPALAEFTIRGGAAGLDQVVRAAALVSTSSDLPMLPAGAAVVVDLADRAGVSAQHLVEVFLKRIHARAARILIVLGYHETVAASTIRLANQLQLPVVTVPRTPATFSAPALTARLMAIVHSPELAYAQAMKIAARKLAVAGSVDRVLAIVGDTLNGNAALVTADGHITAGTLRRASAEAATRFPSVTSERFPDHAWASCPILGTAHTLWLVCETRHGGPAWTVAAEGTVQIAAHAASARLLESRLQSERDHSTRHNLFIELIHLDREAKLPEHLIERASKAGLPLDGWHVGTHFTWPDATGDLDPEVLAEIAVALANALASKGIESPLFTRADGWSSWLTFPSRPTGPDEEQLLARVQDAIRDFNAAYRGRYSLVAGVGGPATGPGAVALTISQAHQAAIAAAQRRPGTVESIGRLNPHQMLATWYGSRAFRDYACQLLGPVLADPHADVLLTTLAAFLATRSTRGAARRLRLHRNTIGQHLGQVRRLLDNPLDEADFVPLFLACRALGYGSDDAGQEGD
ncbi:helix-turn-helix domain-containing protein, partial [Nonomuraea sp. NPDC001684]